MTILYRGPRGLVTHEVIITADSGWQRVELIDLSEIHIVRTVPRHLAATPRALGVSALAVAMVSVPTENWWALGPAAVLLTAALLTSARRDRHVRWELRATKRGARVTLFASTEQREFDQMCRAVRRALEHRGETQYR